MLVRTVLAVVAGLAACTAVAVALAVRLDSPPRPDRATASSQPGAEVRALLRNGAVRYRAYVDAEMAAFRDRDAAGDRAAALVHRARVAPALEAGGGRPSTEPFAVVRAASTVLSRDAQDTDDLPLVHLESHVAGAAVAFDAARDALWSQDEGLVGWVDEALAHMRAELDRHRRGARFVEPASLGVADRRRLSAGLDALAWRLHLTAERLGAR